MYGEDFWFLEQLNFDATKIEIFNEKKCALETINLVGENNINLPELTNENVDNVNMQLLLVKDKFNILFAVFKELSQLCVGMPTFYKIKISKSIKELNEGVHVFDTPGGTSVQVSIKESLMLNIEPLESNQPDLESLNIKFTDGTWVGKRLHIVNFGYTILNEKRKAMADKGNYSSAIIKIKEDYDNIREALTDIVADMKSLNSIVFDGRQVNIQYHLGGDWKSLACVCGIGAANSNFGCIWCTSP